MQRSVVAAVILFDLVPVYGALPGFGKGLHKSYKPGLFVARDFSGNKINQFLRLQLFAGF